MSLSHAEKLNSCLTLEARLGRQGKRPALGSAYVVGKIEEFTNATNTRCWRSLQIVQAFQGFERRRPELSWATAP